MSHIFVFIAGATIIGFVFAINILLTRPSAFPYTHLDNVVAVKGAIIRKQNWGNQIKKEK